ncbi:septal ring lytic transglycosylase RlpA family protein [Variovorax sp. Sphag1AA]|uniref:septal ring lytic transglycosylase RlpA family protein n=1 Tax=Variovorax sp. Sphag1AA TaxID=2587027 RepID=UPI001841D51A|nr:septal ring lytic transglycosylase RlpA family protein [Variovorax sp. Sphag1AA]MBB3180943.1 rare lipoprotein A [Variovorax sp. Sphag1AA]
MGMLTFSRSTTAMAIGVACLLSGCAVAPGPEGQPARSSAPPSPSAPKPASAAKPGPDRSGARQVGKASFYADKFAGRKMADGTRMDPNDDNAASKTLPLGSVARVTNLENGRSVIVTIQDRGPYVKGRIVDLSPASARELGISRADGLARVEVVPLSTPTAETNEAAR